MDLWVDGKKKEAKPDYSLIKISESNIQGLLVIKDQTDSNYHKFKSFPQLMAEGIAAAQQPNWK